ncbi:MAG: glycosyltransferase [Candidatus Woesebacteria bacterium]|nr:MAG: glycosyltransferase [Candidatus Woesebacteria bacterium]
MKAYSKKKVAIVYDRVNKWGGAERVLLALHEIFPNAPLYTSVYDKKNAKWAKVFPKVVASFLQTFPFAKSNHEFFASLMPLAFESFDFSGFDIVISVTSEAAKGIKTKHNQLHICYCLTPTRYLWSSHDSYFKNPPPIFKFFPFFGVISRPFVFFLRRWDLGASKQPDVMIAISGEVQKRIKKYYKRNSVIVYPPVELKSLNSKFGNTIQKSKKEFYLIVSRLVGYKRVDLAIAAFNKLEIPLVVVGTGSEEKRLKKKAKRNIKLVGAVSEKALVRYYSGAKALIMPQEEDFGIVAVEAQSMGVPVIAYKKGGAIDTVIPGKTGIFFDEQKPESLIKAVKRFEKNKFLVDNLRTNAKRFNKQTFRKRFLRLI